MAESNDTLCVSLALPVLVRSADISSRPGIPCFVDFVIFSPATSALNASGIGKLPGTELDVN